ncbi:MAG: single-stranded DNA-binding protein [Armatimonadetes bacterium]|nr:single-stranded DNA-binding protein [Armatimonadota bacterium]MDE2206664.1 single-stranded DNA-binding protein [Armatimonadota bacterium]
MLNRVILIGRLVADPEIRYSGDGTPVARIRIAVDRKRKDESGNKVADFFSAVAFSQSARFLEQYVQKGRLVAIDGRLQTNQWTAQDGTKRSTVEIVAEDVQALDRGRGDSAPDVADAPFNPGGHRSSAPAPEPDAFSGTGPNDAAEGDKDPFEAE